MAFSIKQHDDRPAYVVDLMDDFGLVSEAAIDLTAASSVVFKMRTTGTTGVPKVSRAMTVLDAASGRVQHTWTTADTDTVGVFDAEFEIHWTDGGIETVPNGADPDQRYLTIEVVDDLDD